MPRVTYLGHSGFVITSGNKTLVIDPFLTGNPLAKTKPQDVSCDYVLLTHAHGDHFGDTLEIARRCRAIVVSNFEIVQYCSARGVNGIAMNLGGGTSFPFGRVKMTPALHSSSFPDGTYGGNPAGFLLTIDGKKVYHAGDTALTQDMQFVGEEGIDLAMLPIGDTFTMGIQDAVRALALVKPKHVIPIHYNTFPPIEVDAKVFRNLCVDRGVECSVMAPDESIEL
jgi:L-ascorbate metabolism protein UlaG (beta-lactamase superfamily)